MKFEWDPHKAEINFRKHGVSFDEAGSVFLDRLALSGQDPEHSVRESRYITFGMSGLNRLLSVSHTYRPGAIRIISARRVTRGERRLYEEG
ncbi:MAG: BrnT family toxin [Nitrospirales bacterium]